MKKPSLPKLSIAKAKPLLRKIVSFVLPAIMVVTFLLLLLYIFEAVRPVATADIKVPIATDKASYYPGQSVAGIFFGDVYYNGKVKILREVFCSGYKGLIAPPEGANSGNAYETQSRPRHLDGLTVTIGNLPKDVPVGSNCVMQFTNIYTVPTLFGDREITYQYYTQNFAIITKERRDLLDCEAMGRTDCDKSEDTSVAPVTNNYTYQNYQQQNPGEATPATPSPTYTQPTQPTTPDGGNSEPVTPPKAACRLGVLGLCIVR